MTFDATFWVAVSFVLFIAAIFNPVRKILISSLDSQIKEIKFDKKVKIDSGKEFDVYKYFLVPIEERDNFKW